MSVTTHPIPGLVTPVLALSALLGLLSGCAPVEAGEAPMPAVDSHAEAEKVVNGLTPYGITTNGITTNGLVANGLSPDGVNSNGLARGGLSLATMGLPAFVNWFNAGADGYSNMVMTYVIGCALPENHGRRWTNPRDQQSYHWKGNLGLAPGWASGQPVSELEQQLITACLAAHVNKFGKHITISVLGETTLGAPIPVSGGELTKFDQREACFFGNLFTGEGIYVASDGGTLSPSESSPRACGIPSQLSGTSAECPPMVHVSACGKRCELDPSGTYYTRCQYNGKLYLPITTRIRSEDVYRCGDGKCQFTESCNSLPGTSNTYDNCSSDCGNCPP